MSSMRDQRSESSCRLTFPDESADAVRANVLAFRGSFPPDSVVRHIGLFNHGADGEPDPGGRLIRLCTSAPFDAAPDPELGIRVLTWHLELVKRFPRAFTDEPFCQTCRRRARLRLVTR